MKVLLKGRVHVVAIKMSDACVKMRLPNGKIVDIMAQVFVEMVTWLQLNELIPESGGFIVGYEHSETGNITLEKVSHPYLLDKRSRLGFQLKDPRHHSFLLKESRKKSFYMGVWHTHPQIIPEPSSIDWTDWYETLEKDKTACGYIFFLIAGTEAARVWVGDSKTKKIEEIFECQKDGDLYKKI